ncbi:c-type cytochrome [Falsochrobactrum sp. TDYN1]|uniref:C-type cytochrome n=1 Tax=Falsochrobactrum tianjinense TaxID=2706015 RepID=A0A949PK14_9HYPH|nr:cytochrome c family protein [Falsochrobactrum sp. TDYN1]MBV2142193.1 c-type cytochrome [Falsochrobactrum sp. TDYN1]
MNSTRTNKFIMAFLATVFVVMTTGILSDSLFHAPAPEKPGYIIEAAEGSGGGEAAPAKEEVSIATLLQSADPERGKNVFKRCAACHTAEKGGANKIGPHLWDVVNRPAASVEDFSYSAAMKEFGAAGNKWDFEHLNKFLTSPRGYIKGTAMGFAGDKKDNERADLIAYLRTLSDDPVPLPTVEAAPADAAPADSGEAAPAGNGEAAPAQEGVQPAEQAPASDTQQQGESAPASEQTPAPTQEQPAPAN